MFYRFTVKSLSVEFNGAFCTFEHFPTIIVYCFKYHLAIFIQQFSPPLSPSLSPSISIIYILSDSYLSFSFYTLCFFTSLIIAISLLLGISSIFSILLVICWNASFGLQFFFKFSFIFSMPRVGAYRLSVVPCPISGAPSQPHHQKVRIKFLWEHKPSFQDLNLQASHQSVGRTKGGFL